MNHELDHVLKNSNCTFLLVDRMNVQLGLNEAQIYTLFQSILCTINGGLHFSHSDDNRANCKSRKGE